MFVRSTLYKGILCLQYRLSESLAKLACSQGLDNAITMAKLDRLTWYGSHPCLDGFMIKCKHFPCYWPFVRGIHRSPVNSSHKGQWRGALMFSLICALNKRLSKQWWGWWFDTPSCSLWRHSNVRIKHVLIVTGWHIGSSLVEIMLCRLLVTKQ